MEPKRSERFWNPYLAGIALGLVLLTSFLVMGKGIGASGAANRIGVAAVNAVAPDHVDSNSYMASLKEDGGSPLNGWILFEFFGMFLGATVAAFTAGRIRKQVTGGTRISVPSRLTFALTGGILMGMAARLARGCTSGQALTGGAALSLGSWIFMFSVFAGGYALAYFMRRQWT
jgi:uncharacterized membrane protein YedE/YeeE